MGVYFLLGNSAHYIVIVVILAYTSNACQLKFSKL